MSAAGDFASAAMMRLMAAGLAREGVAPPPPSGAHVPRREKRGVLEAVMAADGPAAVLRLADAARGMAAEPLLIALVQARDVADLLDRWQRMERFSHGRHRVEVTAGGKGRFALRHGARDGGPPPAAVESLLVLGVIAVLAEMAGAGDVTLGPEGGTPWREGGVWRDGAMAGVQEVILSARAGRLAPIAEPRAGDTGVAHLRARIAADLLRRWTLGDLAAAADTNARTLQRRLMAEGTSFSRLVAEARVQVAAQHLCRAEGPSLAETGFLSGFADQAHFTRSFVQAVGTTPGRYRADFGR